MKKIRFTFSLILFCLLLASTLLGRSAIDFKQQPARQSAADPLFCYANHRVGNIVLQIGNDGTFGNFGGSSPLDCFTGVPVLACEYPKNSQTKYLYAGAFWIGAVVGRDTLVSEGADGWSRQGNEFVPTIYDSLIYRSIRFPEDPTLYEDAVSEEDYIAVYLDTSLTYAQNDFFGGRPHRPLNIEVTQRSYAWSYPYAEDFVLFDYEIKNIGTEKLTNTYMGIYVDADVGSNSATATNIHIDDICGFIETVPDSLLSCEFLDTVNIAWIADNDGDPIGGGTTFGRESVPNVTATRIIRTPSDELDVSFNWWVSNGSPDLDYGPRERGNKGRWKEEFRDFRTGALGTPEGDVNKYYILRNREFDFDQYETASIQSGDTLWVAPSDISLAQDIADGYDTRYLLSFGPFNISPGEKLPVSFAYIGGEGWHQSGVENFSNLPDNPKAYRDNLNDSKLGINAAWAARVYDNPGISSNGGDYLGKKRICCLDSTFLKIDTLYDSIGDTNYYVDVWEYELCDTFYYEGDGIPDFQGASPPPAPTFWLIPSLGKIEVRFNGLRSETTADVFSRLIDFEGYRVYIGRDERESSFSTYASYDLENYNKYVWNENRVPDPGYELKDIPYTIEALHALYGDSLDPLLYTRNSPFQYMDSIFYFDKQDFNQSEFGVETKIEKIYPNQAYPSNLNVDSVDASELTDDGYLKYFEYRVVIEDLLTTVPWYVNVTAFDFGAPESDLPALETPRSSGAKYVYPTYSEAEKSAQNLGVYVYPNPYRIDAGYRRDGFEVSTSTQTADDRLRKIHFMNLPARCTIKIYTLDGDLVREIEHDIDPSDPNYSHDTWNLITRNTQLAVTGIYYFTVEHDSGETEIGKIVLIM